MDGYDINVSLDFILEQLNRTAALIEIGIESRVPDVVAIAAVQLNDWLETLRENHQLLPDRCNEVLLEQLAWKTMTYLKRSRASTTIVWGSIIHLSKNELWKSLYSAGSPLAAH